MMAGSHSGHEITVATVPSSPMTLVGEGDTSSGLALSELPPRPSMKARRRDVLLGLLLLGFGAYQSALYFGFHPVPNSDFCAFVKTGEELLSFHLPSSYKRAPVLCILLVGLSRVVGGAHPELTAGWVLNGILHPFNLLLFWLVGRQVLGRSAIFVAIIAILNPVSLDMLSEPVAETPLLFFALLTLYLICTRSRWSYLLASVTTLVRYEGAALIVAAFVVDMIESKGKAERAAALRRAVLASLPLCIWLLGTFLSLRSGQALGLHYLQEGLPAGGLLGIVEFAKVLTRVAFAFLLQPFPGSPDRVVLFVRWATSAVAMAGLTWGMARGSLRRDRTVVVLSLFFCIYFFVHVLHPFYYDRFCATIAGIALILACYGLENASRAVDDGGKLPRIVRLGAQGVILGIAGIWLVALLRALPATAATSERSVSVPYVGIAVVALIATVHWAARRDGRTMNLVAASVVACLVIVSNQFRLVRVVGDGQMGMEYKALADWFRDNAKPGEGIVCSNTCAVELYAPERKGEVTHFYNVKASSPSDFVARCRENKIAYVAWDSDTGRDVGSFYYKLFRFENVEVLREPRSSGAYEFVEQIASARGNRINVFRLREAPPR